MADVAAPPAQATTAPVAWRRTGPARLDGGARRRGAVAAAVVLAALVAVAVLAPLLFPVDPRTVALGEINQAPSLTHLLGTDQLGRDVLLRSIAGMRVSLLVAVATALVATVIGGVVGLAAGALGGWTDRLLMRGVDAWASLPHLLAIIFIVALFRPGPVGIVVAIAVTHWLSVARIVRSEMLSLRARPFVDAAVSGGASRMRVLTRHLAPNVLPHLMLATALLVPHAIFHESALSFLGLGLPPHAASLGTMIADGRQSLLVGAWWASLSPGLFIVVPVLAISVLVGYCRDRLNPRWRSELQL